MRNIFEIGTIGAPIVVVTDWCSAAMLQRGQHMPDNHNSYLLRKLQEAGISQSEIILINPCPIYPGWESKKPPTAKQHKEHVQQYHREFMERLAPVVAEAKVVLVLGKSAAMQVFNSAVAVTKARGQFKEMEGVPLPIMVTLSPAHVMSRPEVARDFETDLKSIAALRKNKWKQGDGGMKEGDYQLITDLSELLKDRPPALAVDTETTGLQWANDATLLTIQLTAQEGQSFILPISGQMFPDIPRDERLHVLAQFRTLMADRRIKVFGHNFKFDYHMMARYRVKVANWWMDTLQLAFAADENMQSKSLKECVRRWVPSMSGYCIAPETLVLTADMRHVKAGELKVGDELLGFDEHPPEAKVRRKMRVSVVLAAPRKRLPCYRIITELGRSIVVSSRHKFLNKNFKGGNWDWREACTLKVGHKLMPFPWAKHDESFDSGYASGIFDGEGWITAPTKDIPGLRMGFAQVKGLVLTHMLGILEKDGYSQWLSLSEDNRKPVVNAVMGSGPAMEALQRYRPLRLIAQRSFEGKSLPRSASQPKFDTITSIEFIGNCEVVALTTSTKTLIAEGLCQHNSDVFDQATDKSNLVEADPAEVVKYGGGDTDATFRLCRALCEEVGKDKRQWDNVTKIQMPALRMFYDMERRGMMVNQTRLRELGVTLNQKAYELESSLLKMVPKKVKQKHFSKGLSFGRREFLQDILFTDEGLKLKPITRLADKTPATDSIHLSNFAHVPFVQAYTEFTKVKKMLSTYVGTEKGEQAKPVSLLKNGGWPVAVRRMTNHEPEELHGCAKLDSVHIYDQDGDLLTLDRMTEWGNDGKCLGRDKDNGFHILSQIPATGFWKHIMPDGKVHASFFLDKTVTGRASCVHADTLIPTYRGLRRIVDIMAGDYVWTHAGRWCRVMRGFIKPTQEMWEVEFSNGEVLKMTEEHLLLTESGEWANLRNVYFKEALGRSETIEEGGVPLSGIVANHERGSGRAFHRGTHGCGYAQEGNTGAGTNQAQGNQILGIQEGREEPDEGENNATAPQVEGGGVGWAGIPNLLGEGQTLFLTSHRLRGESSRDTSGGATGTSSGASHRRGHGEQPSGQSHGGDESGAQGGASAVYAEQGGISITRIKPCGSHPVYDIEVEHDHSYECAGCFSHNSRDPNFQNIPKRGSLAKPYRRIFVPSKKGNVLIECDMSQAELRFIACEALDPVMLKTYRDGGDIHTVTAAQIAGCPATQVTSEMRQGAKGANFGLVYGMGVDTFIVYAKTQYGTIYNKTEATTVKAAFFGTYSKLELWHARRRREARTSGQVRGLLGALRRLPAIHSADRGVQAESERQAINSPIQRVASDVTLMAMSQFSHGCPDWLLPLGTIHDSGIIECPESESDTVASWVKWCFINPPVKALFGVTFPIPLGADVAVGPDLGSMVELKNVEAVKPPWIA